MVILLICIRLLCVVGDLCDDVGISETDGVLSMTEDRGGLNCDEFGPCDIEKIP